MNSRCRGRDGVPVLAAGAGVVSGQCKPKKDSQSCSDQHSLCAAGFAMGSQGVCHPTQWLIFHVMILAVVSSSPNVMKPLVIGGFYGINVSAKGWSSEGVMPAVKMALTHVNRDPSILQGYTLQQDWRDSQCDSGVAIRSMLDLVNTLPPKIMFLGPGCSPAAEPIAEAAVYWGAIQIGYSTTSPLLSDKARFPLFFRTSPSEVVTNPGIVSILRFFKWKRVAIVVQNDNIFAQTKENLLPLLSDAKIEVVFVDGFTDDPSSIIGNIKSKDVRIIIGFMYEDKFREALCQAFQKGIYGRKYVWFVPGWYGSHWWDVNGLANFDCSPAEIKQAAGNFLACRPLPVDTSLVRTVAGKNAIELLNELKRVQQNFSGCPDNDFATYAYDAVWSIALTLNKSIPILAKINRSLDDGGRSPEHLFRDLLLNLSFSGMSGPVKFDKNGDRETVIQILQTQDGDKKIIGSFDTNKVLHLNESLIQWEGGQVPYDGKQEKYEVYTVALPMTIIRLALAVLGVLFSFCCLSFNIKNRTHRFIKMSSPVLNNITATGCAVCYVYVLLSVFTNTRLLSINHDDLCQAKVCFLITGFTLTFGGMFAKTWRVYKIFTNRQLKKEIACLGTMALVFKILTVFAMDIILMIVWTCLNPLQDLVVELPAQPDSTNPDLVIITSFHQCSCQNYKQWLLAIAIYKGVILLFGVFLAWETRNVQFRELNDSHNIGIAVYNIFLCSTLVVSLEFAMTDSSIKNLFTDFAILFCNTTVLCLVFVPKLLYVLRPRNEVRSFSKNDP